MKRITITIALCMIAALLCTLQLCHPESYHDVKGEQYWKEQNEKQTAVLNQEYHERLSALQIKNDSLEKQLRFSERSLQAAKLKLHQSKISIIHLAEKDSNETPAEQLSDCDTLKTEVLNYVHLVDSTQAVFDSTIAELKQIITLKDTALSICQNSYDKLNEINKDNLRREQRLTEELEKAVRTNKRKSIQNKFLAGGLLVLSGIVGSILINGKLK